jgi:membrane-bound lytic murein transglycosylase MltF
MRFAVSCVALLASSVLAAEPVAQPAQSESRPTPAATQPAEPVSIELRSKAWTGDLDGMIERRVVRVLVPYSKTFYFVDLGGAQRGVSYELMRAFEDTLNKNHKLTKLKVAVIFIPTTRDELLPQLLAGHGDIVAANLTVTPWRAAQVDFALPIATGVKEIVVSGPGAPPLRTLDDLAGREVFLQRSSSYYDSVTQLNAVFVKRGLAPLRVREAPENFEAEDLLEMVNAGLAKLTIVDRYLANFWQQIYPKMTVHEDLVMREEGDIAFAIRKGSPQLKRELDAFMKSHRRGSTVGNVVLQKYLKDARWAKEATSPAELKKFDQLATLFRKYGDQYDIDPLLLAAQGYQESGLDHSVRSPVGAIGVMQVMPATGKQMQVGDVRQLEPNIHAGVKYVRFMIDQYYADEPMTDVNKVLFAFASYNAGPARIRSLREETRKRGLDPNVWFNNVERVAAEKIGRETVQYVSNIFKYYVAYSLAVAERRERGQPVKMR